MFREISSARKSSLCPFVEPWSCSQCPIARHLKECVPWGILPLHYSVFFVKSPFCCVYLICLQMCFHCTRSSTCGTHYCWVTPLSHSVLEWPYCSSSGTVSWQMASMSASYCSLTCQVRIWASTYICAIMLILRSFQTSSSFDQIYSACIQPSLQLQAGQNHTEILIFSWVSLRACARVFEFMITSKHGALHSYTFELPYDEL